MEITTALIVIGVMHGVLLFFDNFFKTCAHYPYLKFLEGTGFQINFMSIRWKTKAFNRTIIRWGNSKPQFLDLWFTFGLYTSLILLPISILLLLYSFTQNFFKVNPSGGTNTVVMELILPGVNFPVSELGYYSLTLVVCSIVHEIGHALAAVLENVNLIDTGANILYILPVAYVNISTEKFSALNKKNILKILCAGIWHNLVLAVFAFFLFQALPFIFSAFYQVNIGVTVTSIKKDSPLLGHKGLNVGDTIYGINNCDVFNENNWYDCLEDLAQRKPAFCISSDLVHNLDESTPLRNLENGNFDCCEKGKSNNLCFEYLDTADGVLELPSHVCLPGRTVVEKSTAFCNSDPSGCPSGQYCFRPLLENRTNLFKIICRNRNVIFLGLASDIYRTIQVSPYIPKILFTSTVLPDIVTKFLLYISLFSLGLAIINVIPVVYMDGQYIADILGIILLRRICGKNGANRAVLIVTWSFTLILVFQCLLGISKYVL